ncbi:hypothetical protein ACT7DP_23690 [Bacillus paranthracis]
MNQFSFFEVIDEKEMRRFVVKGAEKLQSIVRLNEESRKIGSSGGIVLFLK